ncbi:MAG: aminodeoxychorismate lyase [Proteobacteria bacterium]|nr:aminodeoxychorismate lyase [Pseudomonadota bacterium]
MILINGAAGTQISAQDRGLHYGDGVFETLAVRAGVPLLWDRHMQRLSTGCARLGITPPDTAMLEAEARQVCTSSSAAQAVLKIIITRGAGARGYRMTTPVPATRILALYPWASWPEDFAQHGVRVRVCATRLGLNPVLAGIKHLNRLEQVLARNEWSDADIPEGLMLDAADCVIEGTMSNVFVVRDGKLYTPDVSRCGIAGIVRGLIMEQPGVECAVTDLTLSDMQNADEVFLCNSVIGVWPVRELDGVQLSPGLLTRRIAVYVDDLMIPC